MPQASPDAVADLLEWFTTHSGYLNPAIHIADSPDPSTAGLHLRANHDRRTPPAPSPRDAIHTLICKCPQSLTLSTRNAPKSPLLSPLLPHLNRLNSPRATRCLVLLAERASGPKSFWHPYIRTLPACIPTPMTWTADADLAWLAGTNVAAEAERRRGEHRREWEGVRGLLSSSRFRGSRLVPVVQAGTEGEEWPGFDDDDGEDTTTSSKDFSFERYLWASSVFSSRSFVSRGPPGGSLRDSEGDAAQVPMLCPVLDIMNHSPHAKVRWRFGDGEEEPGSGSGGLAIETMRELKPGEEVFNNYGDKPNAELLLGYGFCIPSNPLDTFGVKFSEPPAPVRDRIKAMYPERFRSAEDWNAEEGTFEILGDQVDICDDQSRSSTQQQLGGIVFGDGGDLDHDKSQQQQCGAPGKQWTDSYMEVLPEHSTDLRKSLRRIPPVLFSLIAEMTLSRHPMADTAPSRQAKARQTPRVFIQLLAEFSAKLRKLTSHTAALPASPANARQEQAKIFREGQTDILTKVCRELREGLRLFRQVESGGDGDVAMMSVAHAFEAEKRRDATQWRALRDGLQGALGVEELPKDAREADAEDVVFMLWLAAAMGRCVGRRPSSPESGTAAVLADECPDGDDGVKVVESLMREYPVARTPALDEQSRAYLNEMVDAAEQCVGRRPERSIWTDMRAAVPRGAAGLDVAALEWSHWVVSRELLHDAGQVDSDSYIAVHRGCLTLCS